MKLPVGILLMFIASISSTEMIQVQVEQGWLEGERLVPVTGEGHYYSFKGIPYAAPPLGELRFKSPQPPEPWSGVRKTLHHGSMCSQKDIYFSNEVIPGSEDCLFLNVYTPNLNPKTPLPVMFFIHGGGYKSGSGNVDDYGPDFLVNHGVVLVTINYRLEVLGFLCLDTEDVPGNAAMKDQVAALKWVQKNIEQFGGDPGNITIFGESAGGASTGFHVLSPMSKGLFRRAIAMSGVPNIDFAMAFEPRRRAFALGKQLGLDTNDPKELLDFLQSLPVERLIDTNPTVTALEEASYNIMKMYHFTPVVEKDFGKDNFLTEDPVEILKKRKANEVDVMTGYTSQEALLAVPYIEDVAKLYNKYPEIYVPGRILMDSSPRKVLQASDLIRERYFGNKNISNATMKDAVTYFSESCFTYDTHVFIRSLHNNCKRYLYRFSCVSNRNVHGKVGNKYGLKIGASHLEDLLYLFDAKRENQTIDRSSREYKMIQQTCKLFTNFAKYGNPTPDSSLGTWREYDNDGENYLDIDEDLTPGSRLDAEVVAFWRNIYDVTGVEYL